METTGNLNRFISAQENKYEDAFQEVKNDKKVSHWMWYIFPQIQGLGQSEMAKKYAVENLKEAERFLHDTVLGERLINISKLLLEIEDRSATEIFGSPDDLKLQSCMTLFASVNNSHPVFQQIIDRYFDGKKDDRTLQILQKS